MLASTWTDMVMGVDIHFEMVPTPAGPIPTPFPNPFIGVVFDPIGMAIGLAIGAGISAAFGGPITGPVTMYGVFPATNVGTEAKGMGHILIPPGASWMPMPKFPKPSFKGPPELPGLPVKPEDDAVAIMGSKTVNVMGSSQVRLAEMWMSCGEPLRAPSSVVIATPKGGPILVGGPPAVDLLTALTSMIKTKWVAGYLHSLIDRLAPGRLRNLLHKAACFLTGHPVDVATGRVLTSHVDCELPGPLPLKLERDYASSWAQRSGPLGHGWSHSLDQAVWSERGKMVHLAEDGREIEFDTFAFPDHQLPPGVDLFEPISRLTLRRDGQGAATITGPDGIRKEFVKVSGSGGDRQHWLRLKRIVNRAGHSITIDYDERGNVQWATDSGGRQIGFEHDPQGRMTLVKLPHPSQRGWLPHTRCVYDSAGDLVQVTDPLGHSWRFKYKNHLLVQETNRGGLSFYFAYDGHGQDACCVRTWGDGGIYDHVIDYDKKGKKTFVTNSLGQTSIFHMNAVGQVTKVVNALGAETSYEYDERSLRKTKEVDALGAEVCWFHDERGNCTRIVFPDGSEKSFDFNENNQPVRAIDAMKGEWRWEYDRAGCLVTAENPLKQVNRFVWEAQAAAPSSPTSTGMRRTTPPARRLVGFIDAGGNRSHMAYDSSGNLTLLRGPDGAEMRWRYDNCGRSIEVQHAQGGRELIQFDAAGRVTSVEEPDGNVRALAYDPDGQLIAIRDKQQDVRLRYQGVGRLAERSQDGKTVRFRYDTEESLVAIENEAGSVYRFVLGAAGELLEEHGFDGLRRWYERDEVGRMVKVRRPDGRTAEYTYNPRDQVVAVRYSDGSSERYGYRPDGIWIEATNATTSVKVERDLLGRITKEIQLEGTVESAYDSLGKRKSVKTSKGHSLEIERNVVGDVVTLRAHGIAVASADGRATPMPAAPAWEARFTRDQLGLEVERHLPGGLRSTWHRDHLGRPQRHEVWSQQTPIAAKAYTWEPNNRLAMVIDSMKGAANYQHDSVGNLTGITYENGDSVLRMPDAVGNLFKTRDCSDRKYGGAGQLLESRSRDGVTSYQYDAEGYLLVKLLPDGRRWTYEWNDAGMLIKVVRPDGKEVTFAYDALGRRIWKRHLGRTTRWLWDGDVPIHEWVEPEEMREAAERQPGPERARAADEAVRLQRLTLATQQTAQGPPAPGAGTKDEPITWVFDPGTFAPAAKLVGTASLSILTDQLGAPTAMLDAAGTTVWSATVSSTGALADVEGDPQACPFRWPGQYADEETGLHYNRFRYYDPDSEQYVSQDPIGLFGGLCAYAYVRKVHTSFDPFGLWDFASLMDAAQNSLDFSTAKDGAVFWATPNQQIAQDWAKANGKTTLEQTAGGQFLNDLKLFEAGSPVTPAEAKQIWDAASERFARGASGEVNVFNTGAKRFGPHGERTWWRVERPAVKSNPDVDNIVRRKKDGTPCK